MSLTGKYLSPVVVSSINDYEDLDPYGYSDGKWLRNDKENQQARRISFNFDALRRRVVEISNAESISTFEKKDGGFNRVFIFTTNNGKMVVAKVPVCIAGPPKLTTRSEVATMKFLKKHSSVPLPAIYDWSDDRTNEIGSEYIIMEYVSGVSLHVKWLYMTVDQRIKCIKNIRQNLSSMNDISFPAYGSLYTTDDQVDPAITLTQDDQFCIGPHVATRYWDCNVGFSRYYHLVPPNRGPWSDLSAWSDGLIDAGISRVPPYDKSSGRRPRYFGTPSMHLRVLEEGRLLLRKMSQDLKIRANATPTLCHPDLHKRNIVVAPDDPTTVISFLDWQSAGIDPAFSLADVRPDFIVAPDHADNPSNNGVATQSHSQVYADALSVCIEFYFPNLARAQSLGPHILQPFRFAHRTWIDGVVALQHDLFEVARRWKDLGFEGICPFPLPDAEAIAAHDSNYKYFIAAQNLREQVVRYLNISPDGWVPSDAWDATKLLYQELYSQARQAILSAEDSDDEEPVKTEDDLRAIWPFDL
ncbi:hypothetical protein A1O3_02614 [Capronia epimyces CBS 606.96]|uniref:Altered inheritance of mitochondria protein 9, mitochondrial n=1 Tax=Capronia epimyces CBS 606.96 TaxID=1182542 RepID=W9Y9M2_9EURO|nr:uncharacterized protein A1O3_02614 [Capronia epimyces CBS 606.96]EXJ89547.1 hypothetical protein A1O3_02614 [Capronia epimyces CBS 606.96]